MNLLILLGFPAVRWNLTIEHVALNLLHFVCFWRVVLQGTARRMMRCIVQAM